MAMPIEIKIAIIKFTIQPMVQSYINSSILLSLIKKTFQNNFHKKFRRFLNVYRYKVTNN